MASYNFGDIWEYEVKPGECRVALVVSPDRRANANTISVICLDKTYKDGCVPIKTHLGDRYANPYHLTFAKAERLTYHMMAIDSETMALVKLAIADALDINIAATKPIINQTTCVEVPKDYHSIKAENALLKTMYNDLLSQVISGGDK